MVNFEVPKRVLRLFHRRGACLVEPINLRRRPAYAFAAALHESCRTGQLVFNLTPIDAYLTLCERAFPSTDPRAGSNDFTHLVSADSLSDEGHYLFFVEGNNQAKLIYRSKDDPRSVREISVGLGEFQSVVRDVITKSNTVQIKS